MTRSRSAPGASVSILPLALLAVGLMAAPLNLDPGGHHLGSNTAFAKINGGGNGNGGGGNNGNGGSNGNPGGSNGNSSSSAGSNGNTGGTGGSSGSTGSSAGSSGKTGETMSLLLAFAPFIVFAIADLILIYMPEWPPRIGIIATIVALVGAVKFTGWYPQHRRAMANRSA